MRKHQKLKQVILQTIYPFKYYETIKNLKRIGFEFVGYTKYVDERLHDARDSKEAISIKWLDGQYQERLKEHKRNVSNGKKGGLSRAQALRKEKKRKEPYMSTDSINQYLKEKQDADK